jgi:CheY-like chemotaxis protein
MPEPIHVIVVDDDQDVRETTELVLELRGFEVTSAENGAAALGHLAALEAQGAPRPWVMLLDLRMPVMDGWELIDTLRTDGSIARIPIVVCTSSPQDAPEGFPIIAKPIDIGELEATIRQSAH